MMITFGDPLELELHCAEGEPPRLVALRHAGAVLAAESTNAEIRRLVPLAHVELAGHTRDHNNSKRHVGGALSARLGYTGHRVVEDAADGTRSVLEVTSYDAVTDVTVVTHLEQYAGIAAVRAWVRIIAGREEVVLLHAASLLLPGALPVPDGAWEERLTAWIAANPWCGEGRWSGLTLAERGLNATAAPDSKNRIAVASTGSWSSSEHLPMGALVDERTGRALLWQIEHTGSWAWEIGDFHDSVYLGVSGPCDAENQWSKTLGPGESFDTVPVTLAAGAAAGLEGAAGELTRHRRRTRRPHPDHERLPVVFNDYMNCLWGDPSTARLLPLIEAAAEAGAEYFVVDAGWYDDTDGWWDSVGEWQPSTKRFPRGLEEVADLIRDRGMCPGLWLEPEVIGVRSPLAESLPREAFFTRAGRRLTERGRHQLDLRHPAARAHLDETVDRLVARYGLGYLKLDYNIEIGPGTDSAPGGAGGSVGGSAGGSASDGAGDGLLGHNRAYLAWIEGVLDRHPGLVIESCASGGMRTDHGMLAVAQLHSATDQTDFKLMPAIAAAVPLAVTPEQAAIWAYPVPEMTDEETAFTLASALLGRVHLSGRLDLLRPGQAELTREALAAYRAIRADLPHTVPHWPLGLPGWRDGWAALALEVLPDAVGENAAYLVAWRREDERDVLCLPAPWLGDRDLKARIVFPASTKATAEWSRAEQELTVGLPNRWTAVVLRIETA